MTNADRNAWKSVKWNVTKCVPANVINQPATNLAAKKCVVQKRMVTALNAVHPTSPVRIQPLQGMHARRPAMAVTSSHKNGFTWLKMLYRNRV
jgi:hypothetical protein